MNPRTAHRLRKHPDYQRVYKSSRKQWARQMAYFVTLRLSDSPAALRSETTGPRIGLTVPKALGKAFERNRIKRRLREIVRSALPLLDCLPVDVVLHPKRSVLEAESHVLEREVAVIFKAVRAKAVANRPGNDQHRDSSQPAIALPAANHVAD